MEKSFTTKSNLETIALGSKLSANFCGGEFLALTGDLGGGKTQFTKGIATGLGISETVVSPTFTIERVYGRLHHFDLYRVHNDREIAAEIRDLIADGNNTIVIEWPENIENILPEEYLAINFKYIGEDKRELIFEAKGERYEKMMEAL